MKYPFDSIWINGKDIAIQDILKGNLALTNSFEQNTCTFIREWMNNVPLFSLQTSGSTGDPKKIVIRREQMISSASATEKALNLQAGTNALVCLDPQFIAGKMMLVRCFVSGMKIMAVTPSTRILDHVPDVPIELAAMVPYQIQELLESNHSNRFDNIRVVLAGGAALNEKTKALLSKQRTHVYATYGMTETISHIALQKVNGTDMKDYFRILPDISVNLDERDCLVIKAPYLDHEVVTNDIAEIVGNDGFRWLGRWDNVINTGGIKVIPEKIEVAMAPILKELGINHEFFLCGLPDEKLGQRVCLVVKGNITPYQKSEIIELARKKIQIYAAPREVVCLEQFHYTPNNKIHRSKTVEMLQKHT